jgi:hypothetical protein
VSKQISLRAKLKITFFAVTNVKIYGHHQAVNLWPHAVNFGDAPLKMQVSRNLKLTDEVID